MSADRLRVVVANPFDERVADLIREREPRIDLVVEPELLPPMRHPADYSGDPSFRRDAAREARFRDLIDSADALYGIPDLDPAELARTVRANRSLRWVHTMAAGGGGQVKAAGLASDELQRVAFTTSAGVHGDPLAEFAIFGLFAAAKDLPRLRVLQDAREWPGRWTMRQVSDLRVLVFGVGGIGRRVAAKARALGATVVGVSRREVELEEFDRIIAPDRVLEELRDIDAIVTTLPGTDATEKMIGADMLAALGSRGIVINVGRGTVVDEDALHAYLVSSPAATAVLDVFAVEPLPDSSPLWELPNLIASPHTAALTDAEDRRIAELFADNAGRLLDGRDLRNRVDPVEFY